MKKTVLIGIVSICAAAVFALELDPAIHVLGGNVRGFGILAEYSGGGGVIELVRQTKPGGAELKPDFGGFPAIASLRIFDPDGRLVSFTDLGTQKEAEKVWSIALPAGKAGVWRISLSNGLSRDRYRIRIPDTPVWGIRGEMALGIGDHFPRTMYLAVPSGAKLLIAEVFGGGKGKMTLSLDGSEISCFGKRGQRMLSVTPAPAGRIVEVKFDAMNGRAVAFDGVPGLLCPTPEAAQKLAGGMCEGVAGPYQARVRRAIAGFRPEDFDFALEFPATPPDDLKELQLEVLPFGKYGFLGGLDSAARGQVLDPASPFFGANPSAKQLAEEENWRNMLNYSNGGAMFSAPALGSAVTLPTRLNPARNCRGLINRATAAAFYYFQSLAADDIIREGDFRRNSYPQTHAFFAYNALAQGYEYLRDLLPPEHRELWREGVIRIGDKAASFMGYESNQWSHMITGHLAVYIATGEKRFKTYFETHLDAYLANHFGPGSKFGQHPAGFYLEECGPDGNYDHLNGFSVAVAYYKYRALPDADPALVERMRQGIEKNLRFKSFHWLRQPGGDIFVPNAPNCRTDAQLASPSYPAEYLCRPDFDLGLTRFMMNRMPDRGIGGGDTFSHIVNSDEWAKRLLAAKLPRGIRDRGSDGFSGHWTREIYDIYRLPVHSGIVTLPCEAESGIWELPGMIAWKSAGIYGLIFYDVAGAAPEQILPGITSGGPLTLWDQESGSTVGSMRNRQKNLVKSVDDVTWTGIYGYAADGNVLSSGKERNELSWQEPGTCFTVTGKLRDGGGKLRWEYRLAPGQLELTVSLEDCNWRDPVLTLPFLSGEGSAVKLSEGILVAGKLKLAAGGSATLSEALPTSRKERPVKALRIPFPADRKIRLVISLE